MWSIRETLFEAAARAGLDVLSTLVYAHPSEQGQLECLQSVSADHGSDMMFVQLRATREALDSRVIEHSRQGTKKIRDSALLSHVLHQFDMRTPFPGTQLMIDNSDLSVATVVEMIAQHFRL